MKERYRPGITLVGAALWATAAVGQDQPPGTEIMLITLPSGDGPATATHLTERPGYDNQPAFSADGQTLYYTRIDGQQADIWSIDLASGEAGPVAETRESEYSPTPMPNRAALSVVRVEPDQRQRLWALPLDGSAPELLLPDVEPVGYHAWIDDRTVVLFILGEPHSLHRARLGESGSEPIAANIGRGMQALTASGEAVYVQVNDDGPMTLNRIEVESGQGSELVTVPGDSQDVAVDESGRLWMGDGSSLYRFDPAAEGSAWEQVADLAALGIDSITRLAVRPGGRQVAVVVDEPADAD